MQEKKQSLVPELRFPGFEGEWEVRKIEDSFEERIEKNRSDLPLLSLGEDGLMLQSESQRKDNSNSDKSKYLRVAVGDIAYNTMRMWQGRCVYCNIEGIVSPAYTVCKTKEGIDPLFHYYLFKTNQMISIFHQHSQGLVNDTLNLKYEAFSKIKYLLPSLPEQQKIAECLSSVDYLIQEETDQLQALKDHKKGLMQQLFPQDGETIPKRRFPGFEGEWEEKELGKIADRCSSRNKDKTETRVLTNSATEGVVDQNAYFERDIAVKENTDNYHIVDVDDFVYNPRISVSAPVGPISRNKIGRGIMSPLYSVFRFKSENIDFLEQFFNTTIWHKYLKEVANYGARFDRMAISTEDFYSMPILVPSLPEQQKIADCLSSLDEEITEQQQKVEALREHKKGLMQKLFPAIN